MERLELMVEGARTYHISLSRTRAASARMKEPRHFLLYRGRQDLPVGYRRMDADD